MIAVGSEDDLTLEFAMQEESHWIRKLRDCVLKSYE